MAKRIFIVPRWAGTPKSDWYPWIIPLLEKEALQVNVLDMPEPSVIP
jgi:hypothetical protein